MRYVYLAGLCGLLCLASSYAYAQFFNNGGAEAENAAEMPLAKPISLLAESDGAAETDAEIAEIEAQDADISYYVQNLNLSVEQIHEVQKLSAQSLAAQEDILRKAEALRRQARALEISNLMAFEAILDDSQKAAFQELRAGYTGAENDSEVAEATDEEVE